MESFFENFIRTPLNLFLNGTKVTYETIYSVPLSMLRENLYLISISLYLIWYIKAYLSVSLIFVTNYVETFRIVDHRTTSNLTKFLAVHDRFWSLKGRKRSRNEWL